MYIDNAKEVLCSQNFADHSKCNTFVQPNISSHLRTQYRSLYNSGVFMEAFQLSCLKLIRDLREIINSTKST